MAIKEKIHASQGSRNFPPNASIVLVGCRGSGKRSLGFIAATHLKRRFITEDCCFQEVAGVTRAECLRQYGADEFYRYSMEVLSQMLEKNPIDCVIECGMGSLAGKAQSLLREYTKTNPVVYVMRNPTHVQRLLKLQDGEARRLRVGDIMHRACSNFEYYNLYDSTFDTDPSTGLTPSQLSPSLSFRLKDAKQDFCRFVDLLTGQVYLQADAESPFSVKLTAPEKRSYTYAVCVRLSELSSEDVALDELDSGADAVELIVDVYSPDILETLAKQVALIRRKIGVPIIYNAASFKDFQPDGQTKDLYLELQLQGLRLAVEYLVVRIDSQDEIVRKMIAVKGCSKIIGEIADQEAGSEGWRRKGRYLQYEKAKSLGCDVVKIMQMASSPTDNDDVQQFRVEVADSAGTHPPLIAYNLGSLGRDSLIFNKLFTPVDLPAFRRKASSLASSSMTAQAAMQTLFKRSVLDPLHFYLFGETASYSISPALHHAAYTTCGLGHDYEIRETSSLDDVRDLILDPHFGGASITHPLKVEVSTQLQFKSHQAAAIGAVNILLPLRASHNGVMAPLEAQAHRRGCAGPVVDWYGENGDWRAVLTCLRRNMSPRNATQPSRSTGLVIGAGGMARAAIYAMLTLGCQRIFVYNRTFSNAKQIARHFNTPEFGAFNGREVVSVLKSHLDLWPSDCNPASMIISCVPAHSIHGRSAAGFEMPLQWLTSPSGGVIIELSYEPLITPLLRQMKQIREKSKQAWVIVDGIEVMMEQAAIQFELMTGRRAPRRQMRLAAASSLEGKGRRINDSTVI